MDELKRLVEIVAKRGRKSLPILDIKSSDLDHNKELKLFKVIQQLESATDATAAREMYDSGVDDPRYKMLKHRLKTKLLNHLFFVDFKDPTAAVSFQFEQEAQSYLYFSRVLLRNGEVELAEKTTYKGLNLAREGEFTDIVISFLELLREVYATQCQSNNFRKNLKMLHRYRKIYEKEAEANDLYANMVLKLQKSVNSRRKNLNLAIRSVTKLEQLHAKTPSWNIFERYQTLNLWCLELTGRYDEIIRITGQMDKKYRKSGLNVLRYDPRKNKLHQLNGYRRSGRFVEGLDECQSCANMFDKTNPDYFRYLENYFLMALQNQDHKLASDLMKTATRSPHYSREDDGSKERWELYKAYLYLGNPEKRLLRSFDFPFFFETRPKYHKDRKGINVAILILQFLYHFREGNQKPLGQIVASLQDYAALHLYHTDSQRSRIFVKLLMMSWENDFALETCTTKSRVSVSKLAGAYPPEDLSLEIEVIPYPHLWDLLVRAMVRSRRS